MARLTGPGDRIEAPDLLAGFRVVGGDESPDAAVAAAGADDHLVLDHERRERQRVGRLHLGDARLPERAAVLRVDRNEVPVERAHVQGVAENRHTPIVRTAAGPVVRIGGVLVDPEGAPGPRVERDDVVGPLREVHDAVHDERRGLPRAHDRALVGPLQLQVAGVGGRDLVERAVARAHERAVVRQPVLRLLGGIDEPLEGDRPRSLAVQRQRHEHRQPQRHGKTR